jgi:hypothetical protein
LRLGAVPITDPKQQRARMRLLSEMGETTVAGHEGAADS